MRNFLKKFHLLSIVALLALGVVACQADLKNGQTQNEADNIIVALKRYGIRADKKEVIRNRDVTYTVSVSRTKIDEARQILVVLGLPRTQLKGIDEICGTAESLIPSPSIDRCKYQLALQNEIVKALLAIDGVVEAKININLPEDKVLDEKAPNKPTAAVLIKYIADEAGRAPFEEKKIREFVANSVDNLDYNDVAILATAARRVDLPLLANQEDNYGGSQSPQTNHNEKTASAAPAPAVSNKTENSAADQAGVENAGGFMGLEGSAQSVQKVKALMLVGAVMVLILSAAAIATILHLKNSQLNQQLLLKKRRSQNERALVPVRNLNAANLPDAGMSSVIPGTENPFDVNLGLDGVSSVEPDLNDGNADAYLDNPQNFGVN